jgi:hypothetical protein
MADLERARAAIKAILALPMQNKNVRYYAEVALSHLQSEKDDGTERTTDQSPRGQDDGESHSDTFDRKP